MAMAGTRPASNSPLPPAHLDKNTKEKDNGPGKLETNVETSFRGVERRFYRDDVNLQQLTAETVVR